jgi:predicted ester cyclase
MGLEENKELVRQYFGRVDTGDIAVIDDFVHDRYRDHNPPPFMPDAQGVDGARQAFSYALSAFSGFRHEIDAQYAEGDFVITRVTGWGRHTGEFMGIPPTGKTVQMSGITIHRIESGKVVEHWAQVDGMSLLTQLGAIPAAGAKAAEASAH